jgi:hypothetical protein
LCRKLGPPILSASRSVVSLCAAAKLFVNTLLGIFLISVLFLPFLLGIVVLKYAVPVIDQELWILFPTAAHPAYIAFIALLSLLALISGVTNLRKRRWRDAFLCLAILPMIASIRFAGPHSMFGIDGSIWVWPWLIVTAAQSGLNRSQFFLAGAVIGAVVAINAGLLGAGTLCRVASYGVARQPWPRRVVDSVRHDQPCRLKSSVSVTHQAVIPAQGLVLYAQFVYS